MESWKAGLGLIANRASGQKMREWVAGGKKDPWEGAERIDLKALYPESFPPVPEVVMYTGAALLPKFKDRFEGMESGWASWCYQIDHTACCIILLRKLQQNMKGRIILDRGNFISSSCARQCARVEELFEAGCEMRTIHPKGGGFACMHTKTWIIDSSIVLTGSVNLTHNGLENNKEHLWEITNAEAIQPLIEDFERCWIEAEVVEQKDIDLMKETWSRKEEKKSGRARSASASIARSSSAIQEASV